MPFAQQIPRNRNRMRPCAAIALELAKSPVIYARALDFGAHSLRWTPSNATRASYVLNVKVWEPFHARFASVLVKGRFAACFAEDGWSLGLVVFCKATSAHSSSHLRLIGCIPSNLGRVADFASAITSSHENRNG